MPHKGRGKERRDSLPGHAIYIEYIYIVWQEKVRGIYLRMSQTPYFRLRNSFVFSLVFATYFFF